MLRQRIVDERLVALAGTLRLSLEPLQYHVVEAAR